MATHHRAATVVRNATGFTFDIQSIPLPKPQPWEILIKLSATGVCGTDMALAAGYLGPCRDILGHEGVGRVEQIGDGVDPSTIKVGDRVGIAWVRDVCGRCSCCLEPGGEVRCLEQQNSGRKWDGTFAEYCLVPGRYVLAIPDDPVLPDELVAPILCGGVTAYKALKACEATPGSWVAIVGAGGGVGGLGIQYAKAMGYRVAAIDVGAAKESCLAMGADAYFDGSNPDTPAKFKKLTPNEDGAKAVIVTAGSGRAYQSALDLVAAFGTLVCVGIPPPDQAMNLHPLKLIDRGIKLLGTLVGTRTETMEALEFVRRGVVKHVVQSVSFDEMDDLGKKFATTSGKLVIRFE
ncbi:uncharacterized protein FIESC28_11401 [Fusarium coffeatum]|uniref:alcohol dehydrogenase n=1 Tax=Fusarium coffeatum TaxID=231269 RepID=A0A366QN02_9HYPO|nr:uncharacterized protein FIESC28_11401 [Fusarium coffeatum]RBR05270.1 hypothetical protein FIESC28_11401 [Fusarium coffeatum]